MEKSPNKKKSISGYTTSYWLIMQLRISAPIMMDCRKMINAHQNTKPKKCPKILCGDLLPRATLSQNKTGICICLFNNCPHHGGGENILKMLRIESVGGRGVTGPTYSLNGYVSTSLIVEVHCGGGSSHLPKIDDKYLYHV